MTSKGFYYYSLGMNAEFTTLNEKIEQLIQNCNKLQANNLALRQQIANMRNENDTLNHKVNVAINRLETLVKQNNADNS